MTNLFPLARCAKVVINLFNSLPDITQNFLPLFCRWLKRSCRDNKQHFIRAQANKSDVFLVGYCNVLQGFSKICSSSQDAFMVRCCKGTLVLSLKFI